MPQQHRFAPFAVLFLTLPVLATLAGCSGASTAVSAASRPALVAGNWQFASAAGAAARLPVLSGELSGSSSAISGILHSQAASSCIAPSSAVEVSGSADKEGNLTLTGPLAGGTLTITGSLAADGKSLTGASYNVAGGTCGFAKAADATAQAYTPISGAYGGTFVDSDGIVATINATLNQSPNADGDGNYTLTGTAGLPNSPCFSTSTLNVTNTEVTGGTFTFSFTDPVTNASVTANGTFSQDASSLTVTGWTLTNCSTDTGTGTMLRQ